MVNDRDGGSGDSQPTGHAGRGSVASAGPGSTSALCQDELGLCGGALGSRSLYPSRPPYSVHPPDARRLARRAAAGATVTTRKERRSRGPEGQGGSEHLSVSMPWSISQRYRDSKLVPALLAMALQSRIGLGRAEYAARRSPLRNAPERSKPVPTGFQLAVTAGRPRSSNLLEPPLRCSYFRTGFALLAIPSVPADDRACRETSRP